MKTKVERNVPNLRPYLIDRNNPQTDVKRIKKRRKSALVSCQVAVVERRVVVLHISGGSDRCLGPSRNWVACGEQSLCK